MDDTVKAFNDYLDSPEGKAHLETFANQWFKKEEILEQRILRVKEYVERVGIHQIMERLMKEHDEAWRDYCYNKGYEPYANNKLALLFDFVIEYGKPSRKRFGNKYFASQTWQYEDYYFRLMHGQGSVWSIYYKNKCIY
jgi:hypothetical protein